jgi:AcrR family transcriptional regulator
LTTADETTRTGSRQDQAATTRRHLLAAAGAVFEERGYKATTVGAITDRANTAHGTFYLYFRNKEDAFCRVIESVILDELAVETVVPLDAAPRQAVEEGVRAFLGVYSKHAGLWRALLEGTLQSSRVQDMWMELRRGLVTRLSLAFAAQQRAGTVREFDTMLVANSLSAMTEWSAFTHIVLREPTPDQPPDVDALVATLADLWHRAIYGEVQG